MLGYIVLLFSLPNYARSIGLSAHQGSVIGAVLNLGQGKSAAARILKMTFGNSSRNGTPICRLLFRCSRSH